MKKEVEFGIRVSVKDGKVAASDIKEIGDAATAAASQIDKAGQSITSDLEGTAKSARAAATAVAGIAPASEEFKRSAGGVRQATQETSNQIKGLEVSAKQTAQAVRMLPAQMTDVVTQLAGGANPLLVLIQQGGQVKDSFGGIGPMMRGIASAIGPVGLAIGGVAAVTGVLAAAYNSGSKEADGYTRSIVMSGNASGTTAGMMAAAADRIDQVVGTQSAAAETLAKMAGTGRVAAQNLERYSTIAIQVQRNIGIAVDETVGHFDKLGKSPVEASLKLNEQYRYLTSAVFEQIKALEDQGRAEEAAELAQRSFADAMAQRAKQLEDNLGTIERGWRGVTDMAKEAWDAMLGIGRKATIADQLADVASQIENYNPFSLFGPNMDQLKARQASLQEMARLERQGAEAAAANAKQNEARIAWVRAGEKFLPKAAQMEREITKARNEGAAAGASVEEIEKRILNIRKKYEEKGGKSEGVSNRAIADLRAQIAVQDQLTASLQQYGLAADKISAGDRKVAEIQQQLTLAQKDRIGKVSDAELKAQLVEAQRLATAEKRNEAIKKGLQLQADVTAEIDKWTNASQAAQALLEEEAVLFGMGAEARKIASAQIKVDAEARAFLAEQQKKGRQLLPDEIALLQLEAQARKNNIATIEGQRQALAGAEQLRQENRRLSADAIADEQERARAILEIEADTWRERIRLAGEGTKEQRQLQEQFDQWYVNRLNKPRNDEARRFVDAINNDFREGFRNMVNDGKDVWKSASKAMATTFRPSIADALYKAFAQKHVVNVAANVLDIIGLGPGGNLAQAASGGALQGGSLLSAGQSLWSSLSSGVTSLGRILNTGGIAGFGNPTPTGWTSAEGGIGYSGGLPTDGLSMSGIGSMAGSAFTGYALSKALSGGYQVNPYVNAMGAIASAFMGPIGGVISGAINRTFGRKVVGSGILGSIAGDDFSGNAYTFKKGGFLRSDKTETSALNQDVDKMFSDAVKGMYANFNALGKSIGAGTGRISDFTYEFRLALADLDDAGKDKAIQATLSRMSDSMAMAFVDTFRTSVDTATQAASRYYTNTIDGSRTFSGGVVDQLRASSPLDPYIDDIVRLFDAQREGLQGIEGAEGKLAAFTSQIFSLGDALVENAGYLSLVGEAVDFKKLEAVAKEGENVVDTFARINTIFAATNSLATMLGQNVSAMFGSGLQSTDARQRLIDAVGGADAFAASSTFFADNFLSEAERIAPLQKSVAEEMARLGYASVTTHAEFKQAVQELAKGGVLATEAGARTYAGLMKVQAAFDVVAEYSKRTADETIENARRQAEETVRVQRQALSDAMGAVDSSFSVLQKSVDAERDAITKQSTATIEALNKRMSSVTESISKIANLSSMLRSAANGMRQESEIGASRAAAQAQITTAIAIAKASGVLPDADALSQALNALSSPTDGLFESAVDARRDRMRTQISLNELADVSDAQLSIEEQTLQSLRDQIQQEQDNYAGHMARLDGIVSSAQAQIDLLSGIQSGVLSIPAALQQFTGSIAAARANPIVSATPQIQNAYQTYLHRSPEQTGLEYWQDQVAAGASVGSVVNAIANSNEAIVQGFYGSILGRVGEAEGVNYWTGRLNSGATAEQVKQEFMGSVEYLAKNPKVPAFEGGGVHTGGWRLVGERGPELEFTPPSRIFNAADTARMLQGSNDGALIVGVNTLNDKVDKLSRSIGKTADSAEIIAKVLAQSSGGGPILVEIA